MAKWKGSRSSGCYEEEISQLRARIEQLETSQSNWKQRCKLASAEVERLSAENAGLREQLMYARSCTDGQCGSQQCIRCAEDPNGDDPKAYEGTGSWRVT